MAETTETVRITVSSSGVRSVSPAEIFRSEKGREQIRKTARLKVTKPAHSSGKKDRS